MCGFKWLKIDTDGENNFLTPHRVCDILHSINILLSFRNYRPIELEIEP